MAHQVSRTKSGLLSPREKQVLRLAAAGFTDRQTAQELGVSLATIGTYWGRVQIKFGSYNRVELAKMHLVSEAHEASDFPESTDPTKTATTDGSSHDAQVQVSLKLFRGLIQTARDAILVLNHRGVVELANEKTDLMFGYDPGELPGLTVDVVLPKWYHEGYLRNVVHYASNHRDTAIEERISTIAKKKDRTEFPISAALNASPSQKGVLVTCILRDFAENPKIPVQTELEPIFAFG
jgi:PAS domain S-box-containing protein